MTLDGRITIEEIKQRIAGPTKSTFIKIKIIDSSRKLA